MASMDSNVERHSLINMSGGMKMCGIMTPYWAKNRSKRQRQRELGIDEDGACQKVVKGWIKWKGGAMESAEIGANMKCGSYLLSQRKYHDIHDSAKVFVYVFGVRLVVAGASPEDVSALDERRILGRRCSTDSGESAMAGGGGKRRRNFGFDRGSS
ncbi:hypothetical protein C8J57DRAFT_1238438 [Mycena rebaudengoi]|nr:hypothetical protein C8J57DRAFT_1238438 [Mycena rebaudengoi]